MKKTLLKILGTIFTILVFFIAQYHIRQYYGIDPRIWFFVIFGISVVGFIAILAVLYSEIKSMEEYFKTHSFFVFDFVIEICERVKHRARKIKTNTKKIVSSFTYSLLSFIALMVAFTGSMYMCFFHDDFIARTTLYIIFLIIMAWVALSRLIKATVVEGMKRVEELTFGGEWVVIFLMCLIEFLCS